jgi:hypothetical protein
VGIFTKKCAKTPQENLAKIVIDRTPFSAYTVEKSAHWEYTAMKKLCSTVAYRFYFSYFLRENGSVCCGA